MKIALLLSGQPRFYNSKSYNSIKKEILDKYDTDVFFHCWYSENENFSYPFASWSGIKEMKFPKTTKDDIIKLYKPKKYMFEEPKIFETVVDLNSKFPEFLKNSHDEIIYLWRNVKSMFYSLSKSNSLCEEYKLTNDYKNSKPYDFVIRARFDTYIENLPSLFDLNNKNNLYIPDNCPNKEVYNDNFSICSGNISDKIYNVIENFEKYKDKVGFIPENIWLEHLKITIDQILKPIDCQIFKLKHRDIFSKSNQKDDCFYKNTAGIFEKLADGQFYQNFSRDWI